MSAGSIEEKNTPVDALPQAEPAVNVAFPEGGTRGWLTLLGAALVQFTTFGYTNAFGVYQGSTDAMKLSDYYVREYLATYTPSAIGWIGGVQLFLIFTCGLFTGRAFDRGYFYHLMIGGSFLQVFSYFMLSISHEKQYYQVFLSQGIGSGLATGITYVPSLSIVSHYFLRHRPLAMGVVSIGAALGAVVYPIMLNQLFNSSVGFHNGVRVTAAMNAVLLIIATILMKPRLPPKKATTVAPVRDFFRDPVYVWFFIGSPLFNFALTFPLFYLQLDAIVHGVDTNLAFYCLSLMNGTSIIGRVIASSLMPKVGGFNLIVFAVFAMAALIYAMGAIKTTGGFYALASFYGFFSGASIALLAPILASTAKDMSELGARIGIVFAAGAIGGLLSTPVAGALLTDSFHWWPPVIFSGSLMAAAGVAWTIARIFSSQKKGSQFV